MVEADLGFRQGFAVSQRQRLLLVVHALLAVLERSVGRAESEW